MSESVTGYPLSKRNENWILEKQPKECHFNRPRCVERRERFPSSEVEKKKSTPLHAVPDCWIQSVVFFLETTEQRRSDMKSAAEKVLLEVFKKDDDVVEFVDGFVAEFIEESA